MGKVGGIILAGGQNRRMNGRVKALLPFHGEPLILRQIREMAQICGEILVVTNESALFAPVLDSAAFSPGGSQGNLQENSQAITIPVPVRIIEDQLPGKGPLAGMHTGMIHTSFADVWVVACDMPFLSAGAAGILLERKKEQNSLAAIPVVGGRIHPLHGVYGNGIADILPELLRQEERSVKNMLGKINWTAVPEQDFVARGIGLRFATNINTPEAYREALTVDDNDRDSL